MHKLFGPYITWLEDDNPTTTKAKLYSCVNWEFCVYISGMVVCGKNFDFQRRNRAMVESVTQYHAVRMYTMVLSSSMCNSEIRTRELIPIKCAADRGDVIILC